MIVDCQIGIACTSQFRKKPKLRSVIVYQKNDSSQMTEISHIQICTKKVFCIETWRQQAIFLTTLYLKWSMTLATVQQNAEPSSSQCAAISKEARRKQLFHVNFYIMIFLEITPMNRIFCINQFVLVELLMMLR